MREMLDRADTRGEGKVELAEFIKILESNNVQVDIVHILTTFQLNYPLNIKPLDDKLILELFKIKIAQTEKREGGIYHI